MSFDLLQVDDSSLVKENLATRIYREILDGHIVPGARSASRKLRLAKQSIKARRRVWCGIQG